ncbi:MAG: hypothetical protein Q8L89_07295 [Gammaproteobacteria bacterium]|nr:hypothetical protein [Gammaproteobacteria bacterium]
MMAVLAVATQLVFPATSERKELVIRRVNAVEAESSWDMLTDTCTIVLPKNVKDFDRKKVRDVFRHGDPVQVNLGVNGGMRREFTGYITEVSAVIPVVLRCQDEMWRLKKLPANISLKDTTLPKLLENLLPGQEADALEVEIGTVKFSKTTVAEVLEKIREDFGLVSYYADGKLVVGKVYLDNTATHALHLERGIVAHNLVYKRAEDWMIRLTAVSTLKDGSKIEAQVGDEGGEARQLTFYGITKVAELEKLAEVEYRKYKIDGYEGTITCFGNVPVQHGDKVKLTSDLYPEQNGTYYTDKVSSRMGPGDVYHKVLTIGPAVG